MTSLILERAVTMFSLIVHRVPSITESILPRQVSYPETRFMPSARLSRCHSSYPFR